MEPIAVRPSIGGKGPLLGEGNKALSFCLIDYVMTGLALKCSEQLEKDALEQEKDNSPQSSTSEQPRCYYTHKEVRRKTLKRFTTQYPTSMFVVGICQS